MRNVESYGVLNLRASDASFEAFGGLGVSWKSFEGAFGGPRWIHLKNSNVLFEDLKKSAQGLVGLLLPVLAA